MTLSRLVLSSIIYRAQKSCTRSVERHSRPDCSKFMDSLSLLYRRLLPLAPLEMGKLRPPLGIAGEDLTKIAKFEDREMALFTAQDRFRRPTAKVFLPNGRGLADEAAISTIGREIHQTREGQRDE